jgi:hypothetical protein
MQIVKFGARGIIGSDVVHIPHGSAQASHLWRDPELRCQSEQEHRAYQNVPPRQRVRRSIVEAGVDQRADQKDYPGNDSHPVQGCERAVHHVAGQMVGWQNRESGAGNHRGEEDDSAQPDDERKKHQIAKKCHGGFIMHPKSDSTSLARLESTLDEHQAS